MNYVNTFDWIGGVAEYLRENGFATNSVESIRSKLTQCMKNNSLYKEHYYKKIA